MQEQQATPTRSIGFAVAIGAGLAFAFALRVNLADYSPLFDEYASLYFAEQPLGNLWGGWMERETNPPLFYTLLKLWRELVSGNVVSLRLLPILIGVAHIGVIAWLCARFHSRTAAVLAVLILAVAGQHIYLSHLVRGYGLAMLATSVSLAGVLLWWEDGGRRKLGMALYALGAVAAFYCHTTMIGWQIAVPVALLALRMAEIRRGEWRVFTDLLVMALAAGIPSLWWIYITILQITGPSIDNIDWIAKTGLGDLLGMAKQHGLLVRDMPFIRSTVYLLFALIGLGLIRQLRNRLVALSCLVVVGCIAFYACVHLVQPISMGRVFNWLMQFAAIIIACGIASLPRLWMRLAAGALVLVALGDNTYRAHDKLAERDWRGSVQIVARDPGAVLLVQHVSMAANADQACKLEFVSACPFRVLLLKSPRSSNYWAHGFAATPALDPADMRRALAGVGRVYAISIGDYTPLVSLAFYTPAQISEYWAMPNYERPFLEGPFPGSAFAERANVAE